MKANGTKQEQKNNSSFRSEGNDPPGTTPSMCTCTWPLKVSS